MAKVFLFITIFFLTFVHQAQAFQSDPFVTFAHPVRGPEAWTNSPVDSLTIPDQIFHLATRSAIPVTWVLRFDAVSDATISAYFQEITTRYKSHAIGALLEITPKLSDAAELKYHRSLSDYYPQDREKLIDVYMQVFKKRFSRLPIVVGADYLDSYSLNYLRNRYSVLVGIMDPSKIGPDGGRIWGGYLGSPYIPSNKNSLLPAQSSRDRIEIVIVGWTQNDLFNLYQSGGNPAYSLQVNNYLSAGQDTEYFGNLLAQFGRNNFNEFTHLNIGLSNDQNPKILGQEIINAHKKLLSLKDSLNFQFVSFETLANFVLNRYPENAPVYFYEVTDPTGKLPGKIIWYQNSYYRIGLYSVAGITKIIDFRVYNNHIYEDNYSTPKIGTYLSAENTSIIDSVKFPGTELSLDIDLSDMTFTSKYWRVSLQSGGKSIVMNPQDITFINLNPDITSSDLSVKNSQNQTIWEIKPKLPVGSSENPLIFFVAIFATVAILAFFFDRPLLIGVLFAIFPVLTVIRSGGIYPFGLGLWGPNGHDAIFHLSIIEKFIKYPLDLNHPQLSGTTLANYHFAFDYLSAMISRFFSLSSLTVYFLVFPVIGIIIITILLNILFKIWHMSRLESSMAYFFVYLSGSLGFIPSLISGKNPFYSESIFWANQSVSILLNPPYTLSIILLLVFLILLEKNSTSHETTPSSFITRILPWLAISILGGLLAQTKVYAFILLCLALLLTRKLKLLFVVGLFGVLITLPFTSAGEPPFIFSPLWFIKSMFASFDRLWWPKLVQAWQAYEAGGVWPKLIAVNFFALTVFIVGNLGTRLFSIKLFFGNGLSFVSERVALWISLFGVIIPLIFVQNINPWNTIQFIYYSLFFLGIFAARGAVSLLVKMKTRIHKLIFLVIVICFTGATTIGTLHDYFGFYSSSRVSFTEMQALQTLRNQDDGVVLSPFFSNKKSSGMHTPKPLYAYVSTSYISALSGQKEFLSDTINLDITGYDYTQRSREVQRFYNTSDANWAKMFLQKNSIKYVYETPLQKMKLNPSDILLTKIFDSGEINIYKFN